MRVDHGRLHVGVSKKILNGADVIACFDQMGGKAVAQGVYGGSFGDAQITNRLIDTPLEGCWIQVVPVGLVRSWIDAQAL